MLALRFLLVNRLFCFCQRGGRCVPMLSGRVRRNLPSRGGCRPPDRGEHCLQVSERLRFRLGGAIAGHGRVREKRRELVHGPGVGVRWSGPFGQFEGKAKDCFRVGSSPSC